MEVSHVGCSSQDYKKRVNKNIISLSMMRIKKRKAGEECDRHGVVVVVGGGGGGIVLLNRERGEEKSGAREKERDRGRERG